MGRTRHGPRAGYGAGSEPMLDRMACFWSLPEAVRARAGAKLTPADRPAGASEFEELVTMDRSAKITLPVRAVTWALDGHEIRAESYYN